MRGGGERGERRGEARGTGAGGSTRGTTTPPNTTLFRVGGIATELAAPCTLEEKTLVQTCIKYLKEMAIFYIVNALFLSHALAFTPQNRVFSPSSLQLSLGDEIRESQSLFDNIEFTSRSISANNSVHQNRSGGYAPISQSTGQVGTYGVIGEIYHRNIPTGLDSSTSSKHKSAFVPHSSTGAGGARMSPASPYRHAPVDYNSCKSFFVSEDELSYFQSANQQFIPHSSTGAAISFASLNSNSPNNYAPTDYNSSKSFSLSRHEIAYEQNDQSELTPITDTTTSVDLNSKVAPFIPHSSTGAGGAPMSAASPSYQSGRYQR